MNTLTEIAGRLGMTEDFSHLNNGQDLIDSVEVPVLTTTQRQGDIIWRPVREGRVTGLYTVDYLGVVLVRGENGGNTHALFTDPTNPTEDGVQFAPVKDNGAESELCLGTLVVKPGHKAHVIHPEHGANSIGEGTYVFNRQREQAQEIRRVAD